MDGVRFILAPATPRLPSGDRVRGREGKIQYHPSVCYTKIRGTELSLSLLSVQSTVTWYKRNFTFYNDSLFCLQSMHPACECFLTQGRGC